jgi:sarcosine oxidase subunit alpha
LAIPGSRPAGIFSAGTAQKFVNMHGYMPGKRVVILGSGDIGLIMARRMTLQGVTVLACAELMPYSSGLNRNIVQCLHDFNIPLLLSHTVINIRGRERLEGVTIAEVNESLQPIPGTELEFACDTLLLSVGLVPENELTRQLNVEMSAVTQGAIVDDSLQTSMEGVFACGNVLHVHDLVDFVSEESAKAGAAAAAYVLAERADCCAMISVSDGQGVRGVVPQRIRQTTDAASALPVRLLFRPDRVYQNVTVQVLDGHTVIRSVKKRILAPGEMAELELSADMVSRLSTDGVTIRLEL